MANLEDIERLDLIIQETERRAVIKLAEHLRAAVRDLPSQSRLALSFVRHANKLECWTQGSSPGIWGASSTASLVKEIESVLDDHSAGSVS
jgi:hypothetical protein